MESKIFDNKKSIIYNQSVNHLFNQSNKCTDMLGLHGKQDFDFQNLNMSINNNSAICYSKIYIYIYIKTKFELEG